MKKYIDNEDYLKGFLIKRVRSVYAPYLIVTAMLIL